MTGTKAAMYSVGLEVRDWMFQSVGPCRNKALGRRMEHSQVGTTMAETYRI